MKPNEFTFSSVLKVCTSLLIGEQGKKVHFDSIKSGLEIHVFVGISLVDMYAVVICRMHTNYFTKFLNEALCHGML